MCRFAFTYTSLSKRATHVGHNMAKEGADLIGNDGPGVIRFGDGGVLGSPIAVGPDLGKLDQDVALFVDPGRRPSLL